ncbi:hypothetical protein RHRU231_770080 [Rhodococcus ruber]|uniref:Uncharacterized protein n=1 Tax=Rhodococcus ruber TaxID=1830 RepID=A0A098BQG7_9NOCA|nr:hypothetical protein RHRU231_770080 [Rhodococcus ruber]
MSHTRLHQHIMYQQQLGPRQLRNNTVEVHVGPYEACT